MKKICATVGVLIAILITGLLVNAKKNEMQDELARQVFRFHVLANSDSEEDQALKMKVKEEIITYMKQELPESDSVETTKKWARENLSQIEEVAERIIAEEGYEYPVKAEVTTCDFPDKSYGDITFPAGEYEALRIEIGQAKGQNWWCVLYPNLCFIDAVHAVVPDEGKADLKEVLEEDTYEMVTTRTRFKIGWFFF
ncbi:MAG: stage II sporulation protein R [Tyzzerella sp.]|nr:stage II sporulation protein R [Tyzzerella sp.]